MTFHHKVSLCFFTVMLTMIVYILIGGHAQLQAYHAMEAEIKQIKDDPDKIKGLTETLAQRLIEQGGDAKGYYLLGKLYLQQNAFQQAAAAFAKAYELDSSIEALQTWHAYATELARRHEYNE